MTLHQQIVSQFARPRGTVGHLAGFIMARRPSNWSRNRWTVDLLGLEPGHSVLEIGCGPGIALGDVLSRTKGPVTGVDHSTVMIAQSRARHRKAVKAGQLSLIEATADDLPDGSVFDRIYSINVVQFLTDRQASFAKAYDMLAPGGRMVTTYMPRHKGAKAADADTMAETVVNAMQSAGFVDIRRDLLPLEPVPAVAVIGCKSPRM